MHVHRSKDAPPLTYLLDLQRAAGNQAAWRLLDRVTSPKGGIAPIVQRVWQKSGSEDAWDVTVAGLKWFRTGMSGGGYMYRYEIVSQDQVPNNASDLVDDYAISWLAAPQLEQLAAVGITPPVDDAPKEEKLKLAIPVSAKTRLDYGVFPPSDDWLTDESSVVDIGMEVKCELLLPGESAESLEGRWLNEHVKIVEREGPAFKTLDHRVADDFKLKEGTIGDLHSFAARMLLNRKTGRYHEKASSITFHQLLTMYDGNKDVVIPNSGYVITYTVTASPDGATPTVTVVKEGKAVNVGAYEARPGLGGAEFTWPEKS